MRMYNTIMLCATVMLGMWTTTPAQAASIALQNATATFSQSSLPAAEAINGIISGGTDGWAISPNEGTDQTSVFETVTDTSVTQLTFTLNHAFTGVVGQSFALGRLRLSYTTDGRANFADGLQSGGDVTTTWTQLTASSATSLNGATLTIQGDNSILASGATPQTDVYTIVVNTSVTGITGFRLEALTDASLPGTGPGRFSTGNFVLSEFTVDAVLIPEPSSACLIGTGMIGLARLRRRNRISK
jgi:hypothetical protein